MEKIILVLEAVGDEVLEESEEFTIDSDWKNNEFLMKTIKTMVNKANDLTKKWHQKDLLDKSAFVCVDVLSNKFEFAREVENYIDEVADLTCK